MKNPELKLTTNSDPPLADIDVDKAHFELELLKKSPKSRSFVMVPMNDLEAVRAQRKNYRRDPLNPKTYGASLVELSDAPEQPWIKVNP